MVIIGVLLLVVFTMIIISLRQTTRAYGGPAVNTYMNVMNFVHWIKFIAMIILIVFIFLLFIRRTKKVKNGTTNKFHVL